MEGKILVTGATGNVGRHVVRFLQKSNARVVVAGGKVESLREQFPKTEHVLLDFMDPSTFASALEGVNRVFFMRPPQIGDADVFNPFIEEMRVRSIHLVVFLSLMGVEKNPFPPHYKIEKAIERAGLPYAHVRPGFFMQNVTGVHAEEIRRFSQLFIPAGRSKVSFIDAADIGKAVAVLLMNPERYARTAHTLTGSEALDYIDIANQLTLLTGRRITYARPSMLAYRKHYIKTRNLDPAYVNVTIALYLMTRLGTAEAVTDEFTALTGDQPRTFSEFARDQIDVFMP